MGEMTSSWAALLGLGAFHGINPGMGWLFAVALGLQERRRGAVLSAPHLLPTQPSCPTRRGEDTAPYRRASICMALCLARVVFTLFPNATTRVYPRPLTGSG